MLLRSSVITTILTLLVVSTITGYSQTDSIQDARVLSDTLLADTLVNDTISLKAQPKKKKQAIDEPVFYSANDSMSIILDDQIVLLWGSGKIEYQDIELTSEHIVSNLESQVIHAVGKTDTTGKYFGRPNFKKGSEDFDSDSINYNIKSGKGIIYNVKSEQGEGYLHSDLTKRDNAGYIHMKGGKYTTCDADHPHFYMELTKAIAIPNDKIISGPAYLVVEDVPIPLLGLPFGFFPSSSKRGAGVIIPKYGEEKSRGFYLRNGGWYQPLGQYIDLVFTGDIYAKGSWAAHQQTNYKVRYKFSGNSKFDYNVNRDNSNNSFKEREDFRWMWNHRQDPKANPTQTFAASVNFSSSGFDRSNANNYNQTITNQKSSSISYTKSFPGTPFNLSVSANARQNTRDSTLVMDLPTGSFNATTVYPFRKEGGTGKYKWYENIGLSYNSEFRNNISIRDTMLFYGETWERMNYGFQHTIPLSINLKSEKLKMVTVTPSLSYRGAMNSWYTQKRTEFIGDEQVVVSDTVWKTRYAHGINPAISVGVTPKVTGMFLNTRPNPKVIAVRHVMQPRASFSIVPDMSKILGDYYPNYYDTVYYMSDGNLRKESYSYFESNLYKAPSIPGKSGSLSLGLSNNLEMKMKPKNDTIEDAEPEKVVLLRNLNFSTSYNPFADVGAGQYQWSDLSISASTSLFKNLLSLNLTSRYTPYDFTTDTISLGNVRYSKVNDFLYENGKGALRFTSLNFSTSLSLRSKQGKSDAKADMDETNGQEFQSNQYRDPFDPDYDFIPGQSYGDYVDFSIPWSLRLSYSYSINRPYEKKDQTITNTINVSGDFSLTPKWKIGFNSGYDFENEKVTITNLNIHRDLHCWEMRFTVVPFGTRKNYSFAINAKSSILRDLKWDKRDSWYDNL